MTDYVIFTDSTCDLDDNLIKDLDVQVIPLKFLFDGKSYNDGLGLTHEQLYNLLRNKKNITTSQINSETFLEIFENYLKKGTDILYIAFSSGLSGTYASAQIAKEELLQKYPERKIVVIDSLCACMGEGLLVYSAVHKKKSGMDIDELAEWIEENKLNVCHWFTVNDLFYLKRGGRVSATAAIVGSMLGVKPVMHMDNNGKLVPVEKVRGRKSACVSLVEHMKKSAQVTKEDIVFIAHADCVDDANFVRDLVLKNFDVKEVKINYIGSVIGSHAGPGTVALFFMGKSR